ncbi:hypothetical protein OSB04_007689 [Centaurea solstitialis]|uniref:Homeobox-leucine zipper protein n=1 Tax=Centaurea solstitialis TaxID=347529 RepID=A0AA38TKD1_9ASTR|nr:hypothetical protein OSB04_007689 [Centaurea solstitialis]
MESGRLFFGCSNNNSDMLFLGNGDNYFTVLHDVINLLRGFQISNQTGTRIGFNMDEASKKRPFLSSIDDMLEEEYYDEQSTEKKRRLSPEQVHMLERSFEEENKLEPERKTELAKKLGLQPRQVAVWFQNRRARWKTKTLEKDYDRLRSSFDVLTADFESMVKENEKLKAEVVSLSEKLQSKEVEAITEEVPDPPLAVAVAVAVANVKVEEHFSTGSGGSAVVDDVDAPQLVDSSSGDSYFHPHHDEYAAAAADDDGSDNGNNFHDYTFATAEHHHHQQAEEEEDDGSLGWWVWP